MAEKAHYLSSERRGIRVLYKHTAYEKAMEQWVRVQNERDRQVLAWLRERVGGSDHSGGVGLHSRRFETVFVRDLPTTRPVRSQAHEPLREYGRRGGRHLAAIYEILRLHLPDAHAAR
jgi:hypothetical protein